MAHGYPDFGLTQGSATTHSVRDLGELAVRLGSIVSFDRRGDVVYLDDFEATLLKWATAANGTGSTAGRVTTVAHGGEASVELVAGAADDRSANFSRVFSLPVASRLGCEFRHSGPSGGSGFMELSFTTIRGGVSLLAGIRVDEENEEIQYLDSAAAWVKIDDWQPLNTIQLFHTLKLVIDVDSAEYVRLLSDNNAYDLSGIALRSTASAAADQMSVVISVEATAASAVTIYVDDVILTQNEP